MRAVLACPDAGRAARSNKGGTMPVATRHLGKPLKRKEDPRLIQGLAHYVDDIVLPGLLHIAFVRSPYAHAKIRSVDVSKAQAAPGIVLVLTGADVRGSIGAVPCAAQIGRAHV